MATVRGRLIVLSVALALALVPVVPARAATVAVVTFEGTGWGHGVGMSQHGAKWMAEDGASTAQILGHFYPGTSLGTGSGPVRVVVHSVPSATVLAFPNGGEVRGTGEGFPVGVAPGAMVRVAFENGAYRVDRIVTAQSSGQSSGQSSRPAAWGQVPTIPIGPTTTTTTTPGSPTTTTTRPLLPVGPPSTVATTTTTTRGGASTTTTAGPGIAPITSSTTAAPPPTQVAPGAGATSSSPPVAVPAADGVVSVPERGRQYRGVVHATAGAGPMRLINEIDVEQYLRGLGEMPAGWAQAAQGAQSIVARTYALRAMKVNGEICDYARCQVYLGQQAEQPGRDQAVAATRGQVLGYQGQLATAVYASNHGGISATTLEGFGTPDGRYPYLRTVRYPSRDPFPWSVDIALTDLAARMGYRGAISAVTVTERGPSGRPVTVTISGDAGDVAVPGVQMARALRLRSTLWDARLGEAAVAPAPPPPPEPEEEVIQALPDDESALSAASLETADSIELGRRRAAPPELPDGDDSSAARTVPAVIALAGLAGAGTMVAAQVRRGRGRSPVDVAGVIHRVAGRARRPRRGRG